MRLLQVSLRSLLLYALLLVLISIPVSFFTIREIIEEEFDESLRIDRKEFVDHIKNFEYLDDLELDLQVLDELTQDVNIKPGTQPGKAEVFQTAFFYDSAEREQKPFREFSSNIIVKNKPYVLTLRMSLVASHELAFAIGVVQAMLILLLVTGLLLISRSLSGSLWAPFYSTLNKLKVYELDKNQSFEFEDTKIIEFNDLNMAIKQLAVKTKQVFEQQKEFIENASHELQTPLAIFQSKLDMLMQQPRLNEPQAEIIGELIDTAQRMGRLNRNILLLSKIDNNQFADIDTVELSALIQNQLDHIEPLINNHHVIINSTTELTPIRASKTLMEVLVLNLLTNALRYNVERGNVNIILKNNKLIVSNTGLPLSNPDKIFDRFSKESTHSQSSGLGLAIVKKICVTCRYTLTYYYLEGQHHFSIML